MGLFDSLLGGGNGGGNFTANSAPIVNPVSADQANAAYTNAQNALTQQQAFAQAVQQQNGLGNQSQVYNQLQGVANGTGPNPAQAQLAQATQANIASQAALQAGQRGSNANVGLMARQAAQQGAATQQQAVGQGATLQAQQQLSALGQAGAMANQQANQQAAATGAVTNATQGEQGQLLGGIASENNANVANTSNMNSTNASIANTVAGQQGSLLGNLTGGIGSALQTVGGGGDLLDGSEAGGFSLPSLGDAFGGMDVAGGFGDAMGAVGGAADAIAPVAEVAVAAKGGMVKKMADGGGVVPTVDANVATAAIPQVTATGPKSKVGQFLSGAAPAADPSKALEGYAKVGQDAGKGIGGIANMVSGLFAHGGPVKALVSPGEHYLPPKAVKEVAEGKKSPMKAGEKIPGKAPVKGAKNSYANDIVPKTLEEGGIVLPRSVTQAKHPAWEAHKFVSAVLAKQGAKLPKKG